MAQKVEFAGFPGIIKEDVYLNSVLTICRKISAEKLPQKDFRQWMREVGLFDRDSFAVLMEMLDIRLKEPVECGNFAVKFMGISDEHERREFFFEHLKNMNILLVKYCLQALDTENEGRLHSTREFYKMITSYVYPGKYITLFNFQNWIKWMQACQSIKLVGIRWGLTDFGKRILPKVRAIDTDEFLEEEKEQEQKQTEEPDKTEQVQPSDDSIRLQTIETPPAQQTHIEPEMHQEQEDEPETFTDMPAEPAALSVQFKPPYPHHIPATFEMSVEMREPCEITEDNLFSNAKKIAQWWKTFPLRQTIKIHEIGFNADEYNQDRISYLLKAATAGLVFSRFGTDTKAAAISKSLFDAGLIKFLKDGTSLDEIASMLLNLSAANHAKEFLDFGENLIHLKRIREEIKTIMPDMEKKPEDLVNVLWKKLFQPGFPLAPFLMIKWMCIDHILSPSFEICAIPPSYRVRENAFRTGFIDTIYAGTFEKLTEFSGRLGRFFGSETDFESPLLQLHEGFGCMFRCPRIDLCPLNCREKSLY